MPTSSMIRHHVTMQKSGFINMKMRSVFFSGARSHCIQMQWNTFEMVKQEICGMDVQLTTLQKMRDAVM